MHFRIYRLVWCVSANIQSSFKSYKCVQSSSSRDSGCVELYCNNIIPFDFRGFCVVDDCRWRRFTNAHCTKFIGCVIWEFQVGEWRREHFVCAGRCLINCETSSKFTYSIRNHRNSLEDCFVKRIDSSLYVCTCFKNAVNYIKLLLYLKMRRVT